MRSFKTMAATGLAMATLIASVTAAGAVPLDPTAKIFEARTDEEIVIPAVPAYADPYEAFENEIWEARREAELKVKERESAQAALQAARAVDPFEAAFVEQVMAADGLILRSTSSPAVTSPAAPAYADSYEAFENEVWERETARAAARAPHPVVTIGAGDLDEQLMAFALQNEVDVRTLPSLRTEPLGVDPDEEHGRLIDQVLRDEMSELPAAGIDAFRRIDPYEEHGRLIDYVLHVEMSE